jgi:hypothetical protein
MINVLKSLPIHCGTSTQQDIKPKEWEFIKHLHYMIKRRTKIKQGPNGKIFYVLQNGDLKSISWFLTHLCPIFNLRPYIKEYSITVYHFYGWD